MTRSSTGEYEPGTRYGRRWLSYAWSATWKWVRTTVGIGLVAAVGVIAAVWFGAPMVFGRDADRLASEEIALFLLGTVGSAVAVFVVRLLAELYNAPAAMEREEAVRSAAERSVLEAQLAVERQQATELRDRTDASRLRLSIRAEDGPLMTVESSDDAKASFIQTEERALKGPLGQSASSPFEASVASFFDQENRQVPDYLADVSTYLDGINKRWRGLLGNAATYREIAALELTVLNEADVAAGNVEIELMLPPGVRAAWPGDAIDDDEPDRPDEWGTNTIATSLYGYMPPTGPFGTISRPGEIEERDGEVRVAWDPIDLPAHRPRRLATVLLYVPDEFAGQTLVARWTAASVPGGPPSHGELPLTCAEKPYPAAALIREYRRRE